jgi:cytochrome c oxidase cbb3-type subunit 3
MATATGGRFNTRLLAISAVVLIGAAAMVAVLVHRARLSYRLVAAPAESVPADATLVRFAHQVAGPVYARNCASCHGANMQGNQALGAPNLVDKVWLYDGGSVSDIQRTILYGVRSGHAKSHNITDMPAVGRLGVLKAAEINDVVEYVEQLSHQPADAAAAARGEVLFKDKGNCFDCHAPDGSGNPDYGSADLTANTWTYGGDRATLFKSIRDGRHGYMEAYINKLSPAQIRALAVDIYMRSHKPAQVASN